MSNTAKMKIEIWSDIACPFCYIGKRHYELAIQKLEDSSSIELEWYSYQLDPTIPSEKEDRAGYYDYLQDRKGMSRDQVDKMFEGVKAMGAEVGIEFNFDKAIVANSLDAHRLLHLAKSKGLSDIGEETLFKAHFTDGLDVGDKEVLLSLGKQMGLDEDAVQQVLKSNQFAFEVNQDIQEAANIGVQGVPFFVFNRKYGISGAQPVEAFKETIEKALSEWKKDHPSIKLEVSEGNSCDINGNCD